MHDREVETAAESARNRRILAGVAVLLLILAGALGAGFALSDRTAVSVTPEAAGENFEIAVVDGTAIALGGTVFSLSAPPIIAVRSHGFGETVVLLRMDELGGTVAVALTPLPGRLLVSTTLGVDGVLWSLNDDRWRRACSWIWSAKRARTNSKPAIPTIRTSGNAWTSRVGR